jgi:hypothetical protein
MTIKYCNFWQMEAGKKTVNKLFVKLTIDRGCLLPNENVGNLNFLKAYSKSGCQFECAIQNSLKVRNIINVSKGKKDCMFMTSFIA